MYLSDTRDLRCNIFDRDLRQSWTCPPNGLLGGRGAAVRNSGVREGADSVLVGDSGRRVGLPHLLILGGLPAPSVK